MNEAYPVVVETATIPPVTSPRLLDGVRGILRAKHYSYRTEQAYVHWIRRFIRFHGRRQPKPFSWRAAGRGHVQLVSYHPS